MLCRAYWKREGGGVGKEEEWGRRSGEGGVGKEEALLPSTAQEGPTPVHVIGLQTCYIFLHHLHVHVYM